MTMMHRLFFQTLSGVLLLLFVLSACAPVRSGSSRKETGETRVSRITHREIADAARQRRAKETKPCPDETVNTRPLPGIVEKARIVVRKGERRLLLYSENELLRVYPVKIGVDPVGDKVKQGDGRTPEGTFYVCVKNPKSKYYLSLGLSYPNIEDAERGLRDGLISEEQYREIVTRISRGAIPPWNTGLGGEIFIHGQGEIWDWTYGCVALENMHMEELYQVVSLGARVEIYR